MFKWLKDKLTKHDLTKRFWLFGNRHYYSQGGLGDVQFTAQELGEVIEFYKQFDDDEQGAERDSFDWYIYDREEGVGTELNGEVQ